jgi:NAD(P)H-hydrate epimerase
MASTAAYRSGAGLVRIALPGSIKNVVASHAVEPVFLPLPEAEGSIAPDATALIVPALSQAKSCILGCGMGWTEGTSEFVRRMIGVLEHAALPSVIDADALNALSELPHWWRARIQAVLTPHPGEMSRLTGMTIPDIQGNRIEVAREHARTWGVVVVLKGAGTVVAHPDGRTSVNITGGPNLATAGTGDILAGVIGGLLAQGCDLYDAARLGVYLHGMAGDMAARDLGNAGTVAGDLLPLLPQARHRLHTSSEEDV